MKKLLTNKIVYEKRYELAGEIPEIVYIIENFEKGKGECKECDQKVFSLTLYNYIIYALQSEDKDYVKKIVKHFDNEYIIDGSRYTERELLKEEFVHNTKKKLSLWSKTKGFFRSAVGVFFKSLKNGSVMSSVYERRKRLAICKSCTSYDRSCDECTECGCPMKRKVKFKYAECPRRKW